MNERYSAGRRSQIPIFRGLQSASVLLSFVERWGK